MKPYVGIHRGPDAVDVFLVVLYLLGIYLGVEIRLTASTPVPTVLSGLAGAIMLLKHMHRLREDQIGHLLLVVVLFLGSIFSAADVAHIGKRTTGLLQLVYSFAIGYGLYVTAMLFDRRALASIFGWFSVIIVVGCAVETYVEPFRTLSDTVRGVIFSFGVYAADARDLMLYGKIRPKLFTSEPSAVSFGFVLFSFCWYVLSTWRWKLVAYLIMYAAGFTLMRGPTLVLGLSLLVPYELFLAPRRQTARGTRYDMERGMLALSLALLMAIASVWVGLTAFAERVEEIRAGTDPSFFSRITAPFLVAIEVMREHPLAGIGLTAEHTIEEIVNQVYAQGGLVSDYTFGDVRYALTNYFWTHWIYLGALWGVLILIGISLYLRSLNTPSILFCWSIWAILGQASGAYVSPKTWTVLYLACIVAILHQRYMPRPLFARRAVVPSEGMLPNPSASASVGWPRP